MNFRLWANKAARDLCIVFLEAAANIVVWYECAQTRLKNSLQTFAYPRAEMLPQTDNKHGCRQAEVNYVIGSQKYTVIVDVPFEKRPAIIYAAFEHLEKHSDNVLLCTELIESLWGPNGDTHQRAIRPKDILELYYPQEQAAWSEGTLVIIYSDSLDSTSVFDMNDVVTNLSIE